MRRVQAAEIMLDAGMESIAFPILRELLTLIETHRSRSGRPATPSHSRWRCCTGARGTSTAAT
jgi:hypothetical protein